MKHILFMIYCIDESSRGIGDKMILTGKLWSTIFYIVSDDVPTQLEPDGLY